MAHIHKGTEHCLVAYAVLLSMFAMFLIFTQLTTPAVPTASVVSYEIR